MEDRKVHLESKTKTEQVSDQFISETLRQSKLTKSENEKFFYEVERLNKEILEMKTLANTTEEYYKSLVDEANSRISDLNDEIESLQHEVTNEQTKK